MKCPDCHKTVDSLKEFCPYCGTALPKTEKASDEPVCIRNSKRSIIELAVATGIVLLTVLVFRLAAGALLLSICGESAVQGFHEALGVMRVRIVVLALIGFLVNGILILLNKNGSKILYYIAWGTLCIGGVLILAFENPQAVLRDRNVSEEVLPFAVNAIWVLRFTYGLGVPLLQAALYLSIHKPMSGIYFVATIASSFIGTLGGARLGVFVFNQGISGLMFSISGSILAFAVAMVLNRGKKL